MARELQKIINERIERRKSTIVGHALSTPYLKTFALHQKGDPVQTQTVWVVDVVIHSNYEKLDGVPLAESGRKVRDFINLETPVELSRNAIGQFYVIGLSDRKRGKVNLATYSLVTAKLQYTDGWRLDAEGNPQSGNSNTMTPGTPEEIEYSYTSRLLTYGELTYGTTAYGATIVERTP